MNVLKKPMYLNKKKTLLATQSVHTRDVEVLKYIKYVKGLHLIS